MEALGLWCEFSELSTADMQMTEQEAYARKETPAFKEDIRQGWILLSLASRGEEDALDKSAQRMYGCMADEEWPRIVAQRKAMLGKEYSVW